MNTCEHTKTNFERNRCGILSQMVDKRVCWWCRKNTTRDAKGVPEWPEKPTAVPVASVGADPAVRATITRQQAGCRGCGDSPLEGI